MNTVRQNNPTREIYFHTRKDMTLCKSTLGMNKLVSMPAIFQFLLSCVS
jgi:hypothetical protein